MIYYNCNYINCENSPKIFKILKPGFQVKNSNFFPFQNFCKLVSCNRQKIYNKITFFWSTAVLSQGIPVCGGYKSSSGERRLTVYSFLRISWCFRPDLLVLGQHNEYIQGVDIIAWFNIYTRLRNKKDDLGYIDFVWIYFGCSAIYIEFLYLQDVPKQPV